MLNINDYSLLVMNAISKRPPSAKNKYHLCHYNDSISCLPRDHTKEKHKIFRNIQPIEFYHGFTSGTWHRLSNLLQNFYLGESPCQKKLQLPQTKT